MLLYHGTAEQYLDTILKDGLAPRSERMDKKGNWEKFPSRKDAVYLTTAYPWYFASQVDVPGRRAVLEIDTDKLNPTLLLPDEDFIFWATGGREVGETSPEGIKQHRQIVRDLPKWAKYWEKSVEKMGTCAYQGTVPSAAISRVCVFDYKKRPELTMWMLQPSITPLNYAFCSQEYIRLNRWMFGDIAALPHDLSGFKDPARDEYWGKQSADRTGIEVRTFT